MLSRIRHLCSLPYSRPSPLSGWSLVGPLFRYDVLRLTRAGRGIQLRCLYAFCLLLVFYGHYRARFGDQQLLNGSSVTSASLLEMARFGEQLVLGVLTAQTLAILVVLPAFVGSAIAEERERGTLDLLLTTHLTRREIVLGKVIARATHMGGILLAGAPVLAIAQLWGGINAVSLMVAMAATSLMLFSVGAICIYCSVEARGVPDALAMAYALMIFFGIVTFSLTLCWPPHLFVESNYILIVMNTKLGGRFTSLFYKRLVVHLSVCALWHCSVGLVALFAAIARLQPRERRLQTPPEPSKDALPPASEEAMLRDRPSPSENWPLLWKETSISVRTPVPDAVEFKFFATDFVAYLERALFPDRIFACLRLILFLAVPVIFVRLVSTRDSVATVALGLRFLVSTMGTIWCIIVGFRAASGIGRERDAQTLQALLLLPIDRRELLAAKWLGPILHSRGFGYAILLLTFVAVAAGIIHPVAGLLLLLSIATHVALLASLGVWLSNAASTTLRANVTMALLIALLFGFGVMALESQFRTGFQLTARAMELNLRTLLSGVGVNPLGGWWLLNATPVEFARMIDRDNPRASSLFLTACLAIVGSAVLSGALWLMASWKFEREGKT